MSSQKVQEYLVQSGQYAQLVDHLRSKLEVSGWYDDVNALATREASTRDELNFEDLASKIEGRALAIVPDEIKIEMLQLIKKLVDQVVEQS